MTNQQTDVLYQLQQRTVGAMTSALDAASIAAYTGYPQASVRRTVGELRCLGHNIQSGRRGYRLVVTPGKRT